MISCLTVIVVAMHVICVTVIIVVIGTVIKDSLRGSSVNIGTIRLAWPLRKDDTQKTRSVNRLRFVTIVKEIRNRQLTS